MSHEPHASAPRRTPRQGAPGGRGWALVVVLVVTVVLGVWGVQAYESAKAAPAEAEPALVTPKPQIHPASAEAPAPTLSGLAAVLDPLARDPALATFTGQVLDGPTGKPLWQRDADAAMTPASTLKVITAAAAVLALPADSRLATRVVAGAAPGQVVVIGGGDPTLSGAPVGERQFYAGAARLDDLVAQVKRAHPGPVDEVVVDLSAYQGPNFAPGWQQADIAGGFIAPMEPLMLDGGRTQRSHDESPRSPTPAIDAGKELARRLGADPELVRPGFAPAGAAELAKVLSAPLRDRIAQFMAISDNVLAEATGREVARAQGRPASFDGAVAAESAVLSGVGVDLDAARRLDSNGLSTDDQISARTLALTLAAATGSTPGLRPLLDVLPVAGATGTLSSRYHGAPGEPDLAGAGWVRAKTGTLDNVSTLAGEVVDQDGRVLVFAFMSNEGATWDTRGALDKLASALRTCGCQGG